MTPPTPETTPRPAPAEIYLKLRKQVLESSREKFGFPVMPTPTQPWGVMMDWELGTGIASVFALSDGSASIYLSTGGGFIGGQRHEIIRKTAQKVVALASTFQDQMQPATEFPLPEPGQVVFYFLTDSGIFTSKVIEKELRSPTHPFTKLGGAFQELITRYSQLPKK